MDRVTNPEEQSSLNEMGDLAKDWESDDNNPQDEPGPADPRNDADDADNPQSKPQDNPQDEPQGDAAKAETLPPDPWEPISWIPGEELKRLDPVLMFADKVPLTRGNISMISGKAKTGKSAFREGMISAMLGGGAKVDCLGWKATPGTNGAVVVFDYEQCKEDFCDSIKRSFDRIGVNPLEPGASDRLSAYRPRDLPLGKRASGTDDAIDRAEKKQGSIDLIVIDGGADLVASVNDEEQCNRFVDWAMALASHHNCHVVVIVHTNEANSSGDDARGHLGKQLQRKAEAVFTLDKEDSDTTKVWTPRHRKAGISKESPFVFRWSDERRMHITADPGSVVDAKREELIDILLGVAKGNPLYSAARGELKTAIMDSSKVSVATANRRIDHAKDRGLLEMDGAKGRYRLGREVQNRIHEAETPTDQNARLSESLGNDQSHELELFE